MSAGDDMVRLARAREAMQPVPHDDLAGPLTFFSRDIEVTLAELHALRRWAEEAAVALQDASTLSSRWAAPGDGLHLATHDRLLHELDIIRPQASGPRRKDSTT